MVTMPRFIVIRTADLVDEYLLDDNNKVLFFDTEGEALKALDLTSVEQAKAHDIKIQLEEE